MRRAQQLRKRNSVSPTTRTRSGDTPQTPQEAADASCNASLPQRRLRSRRVATHDLALLVDGREFQDCFLVTSLQDPLVVAPLAGICARGAGKMAFLVRRLGIEILVIIVSPSSPSALLQNSHRHPAWEDRVSVVGGDESLSRSPLFFG